MTRPNKNGTRQPQLSSASGVRMRVINALASCRRAFNEEGSRSGEPSRGSGPVRSSALAVLRLISSSCSAAAARRLLQC